MLAQKSELRERLVAHVLPFQTFRIQVSGSLYQVSWNTTDQQHCVKCTTQQYATNKNEISNNISSRLIIRIDKCYALRPLLWTTSFTRFWYLITSTIIPRRSVSKIIRIITESRPSGREENKILRVERTKTQFD